MLLVSHTAIAAVSLSARRAWIEISLPHTACPIMASLSARRAWIEIPQILHCWHPVQVALRKESVDRNHRHNRPLDRRIVALRKESVDRNTTSKSLLLIRLRRSPQGERGEKSRSNTLCKVGGLVALRKESVDRNNVAKILSVETVVALRKESVDRNSPRSLQRLYLRLVALRKESVDRNIRHGVQGSFQRSLSARRAWIEIAFPNPCERRLAGRSPQGERG